MVLMPQLRNRFWMTSGYTFRQLGPYLRRRLAPENEKHRGDWPA